MLMPTHSDSALLDGQHPEVAHRSPAQPSALHAIVQHDPSADGHPLAAPDNAESGVLPLEPTHLIKRIYHSLIDSALAQAAATLLARLLPEPHIALTHYTTAVPDLPSRLDGLRVLHISDLHLRLGSELALELPSVVAGVEHDVLVYTGDFIDDDAGIDGVAAILRRMPRRAPAFAVLGNHDYWPLGRSDGHNDVPRLRAMLSAAGVQVLRNAARPLFDNGLYIVGVDDPCTHHDDLDRAMSAVPAGACALLLVHTPDMVLHLGQYRPGLLLAGHTHGGQIRLPLVGPLLTMSNLPRDAVMGRHTHQGTQMFVSRGIGYSGLNLRINCPAEVAVHTLRHV